MNENSSEGLRHTLSEIPFSEIPIQDELSPASTSLPLLGDHEMGSPPPTPGLPTIPLPDVEPMEYPPTDEGWLGQRVAPSSEQAPHGYGRVAVPATQPHNTLGLQLLPALDDGFAHLQQLPVLHETEEMISLDLSEILGLDLWRPAEARNAIQLLLWLIVIPFVLAFIQLIVNYTVHHAFW